MPFFCVIRFNDCQGCRQQVCENQMSKIPSGSLRFFASILSVLFLTTSTISAGIVKVNRMQTYKQEVNPEIIDNYLFATYFTNNKKAYNLRGFEIGSPGNQILDIKINPAGYSFALLYGKAGKNSVRVQSLNPSRNIKEEIKGLIAPTAICYMPDSRQIAVADDNKIKFFNSKSYELEWEIPISASPSSVVISPNGQLAIATYTNYLQILTTSTGEVRKTIDVSSPASVAFNPSSTQFGILTEDGKLIMYSVSDLSVVNTFENLGVGKSLFFHPDENYVGMIADGNRVEFINLYDEADRPVIYDKDLTWGRFVHDGQGDIYLATAGNKIIRYRQIDGFAPNYSLVLNEMVEERMREWTKMRPGETEIEYRERVNEDSIRRQRLLFINEAASELALAAGLGNLKDVTLGRYNPADGTLIISLGTLNDIYLKVPPEDMAGFGDGNNLQFSNHVFSLTPDNNFELIYVQVYNPTNNKTYTFDNLERQDLGLLMLDDNFVSLDLIIQSSREDLMLNDIKNQVLEEARSQKILSDHTTIEVNTQYVPATDDIGRKINNCHVDFSYMVDEEGSAKEDFAPGKYRLEQSPAALSLARIIQQSFATDEFAQYLVPGKKLVINITGSADALPINGAIAYDGSLGQFDEEPCYINGNLTTVSVNSKDAIRTNEQLAFMRAQALQQNMIQNLTQLNDMVIDIKNNIEVSKEKGAEHRRINVSLIFIDATSK